MWRNGHFEVEFHEIVNFTIHLEMPHNKIELCVKFWEMHWTIKKSKGKNVCPKIFWIWHGSSQTSHFLMSMLSEILLKLLPIPVPLVSLHHQFIICQGTRLPGNNCGYFLFQHELEPYPVGIVVELGNTDHSFHKISLRFPLMGKDQWCKK